MWEDVLTKPLQGLKFMKMRAFLMNCPVNYSEEPTSNPTSAPFCKKTPPRTPTSTPSIAPMKLQDVLSKSSSWGCVGTHGKIVTWRDVVAPRVPS